MIYEGGLFALLPLHLPDCLFCLATYSLARNTIRCIPRALQQERIKTEQHDTE